MRSGRSWRSERSCRSGGRGAVGRTGITGTLLAGDAGVVELADTEVLGVEACVELADSLVFISGAVLADSPAFSPDEVLASVETTGADAFAGAGKSFTTAGLSKTAWAGAAESAGLAGASGSKLEILVVAVLAEREADVGIRN